MMYGLGTKAWLPISPTGSPQSCVPVPVVELSCGLSNKRLDGRRMISCNLHYIWILSTALI